MKALGWGIAVLAGAAWTLLLTLTSLLDGERGFFISLWPLFAVVWFGIVLAE